MDQDYRYEKLNDNIYVCVSKKHRFGTDAFLISNFAKPKIGDTICDFGTGCGIIPLIIESNNKKLIKRIYGIDIQNKAIEQFNLSLDKSNLSKDKFIPINDDIKNIKNIIKYPNIDLVISNPPYKAANSGIISKIKAHQIANHEILCTIDDICFAASSVLKFRGRICLCQRPERLPDIITSMKKYNIEPKRLRLVLNNYNSKPWLILIEGIKGGKPFMKIEENLIIRDNGKYSDEMLKIYNIKNND